MTSRDLRSVRQSTATERAAEAASIVRWLGACALLTLWGCSEGPDQPLQIGHAHYVFPPSHIMAMRQRPELFVRIRRPGEVFDIVYDGRTAASRDTRGVPVVFSISDSGTYPLDYYRTSSGTLVCRRATNPHGGCGATLVEAGASWSVLIPPARASEVGRIVAEARAALKSYQVR